MEALVTQLFNGLSQGSILLMIAVGLAVTFGLMGVINMAHGELIMVGAYSAFLTQNVFFSVMPERYFDLYFVFAVPLSFLVAAAFGAVLEVTLIRRLYGRPLDSLLATWGVGIALQQIARSLFGASNVEVQSPGWLSGGLEVMSGVVFSYRRLFIIGLAAGCMLLLYLYLYRTASGRRVRAVMQNREMASCLGVSTKKIDLYTFAVGAGLAGVAGCALTLLGSIGPTLGLYYIVDAFMVVVLGGIGMLAGTVAAAFGIGTFGTLFEYWTTASTGKVLVFALIVAFLYFRPSGLVTLRSRALE